MNSAIKLGLILREQNWDPAETMTALIMQFAGLTYQLGMPSEEANEVCQRAIKEIYETMDELMNMGSRTLQ
jgi:hypothetical protein